MGLFHRKNKKKSIMLDDKYTIRLEFADQFKPENNTQVAEAIQSASETEKKWSASFGSNLAVCDT